MTDTSTSHLRVVQSEAQESSLALSAEAFNVWFKTHHILQNIEAEFPQNQVTCIVGPSGSGKSTLIRSVNRINDDVAGFVHTGSLRFEGRDVYEEYKDPTALRCDIGMVFQKPTLFPVSILENVLFGVGREQKLSKFDRLALAEEMLKAVSLWKEVAHRLDDKASALSGGQQQRLCLARALAMRPKVLLLDEPTASVDPVSGRAIEGLLLRLKQDMTIIVVTHDLGQMKRIADHVIFMCDGQVIEQGPREALLQHPARKKTRSYLDDSFCDC